MFNLFRNFITALEAKSKTETAYRNNQQKIRDAIEKDIESATKYFKYSVKYSDWPGRWHNDEVSYRAKLEFVIEHKEEFEAMGYKVTYAYYNYDKSGSKKIASRSLEEAQYAEAILDWRNEGENQNDNFS